MEGQPQDVPQLMPVGTVFRSEFGPDYCHSFEGVVVGHYWSGRTQTWTLRTVQRWKMEKGEHPSPGWWNNMVAEDGQLRHVEHAERITILGQAPAEWCQHYVDQAGAERRRKLQEQATAAQLSLF